MIVTGEASGDLHGANLAKALQAIQPDIEILGMGGAKMRAAGVKMILGIDRLDVMGLIGLGHMGAVVRAFRAMARFLRHTTLDAVVFIDHPGFNLRMARIARKAGHRVIYYIAPQIWAWAPSRIHLIARRIHRMIVILPFEKEIYRKAGVPCEYVGHPLLDDIAPHYDRSELRKRFGLEDAKTVIGLLPGSREREVRVLLPIMCQASAKLARRHQGVRFILAVASSVPDGLAESLIAGSNLDIQLVKDQSSEVMAASDVLLVASGTATLQAAVIGTPMVILYRASWLTYVAARSLIRVKWIGLVNIVAGRGICKELIQHHATPESLSEEAERLLVDQEYYQNMQHSLREVRAALGDPGASRRAAAVILEECRT